VVVAATAAVAVVVEAAVAEVVAGAAATLHPSVALVAGKLCEQTLSRAELDIPSKHLGCLRLCTVCVGVLMEFDVARLRLHEAMGNMGRALLVAVCLFTLRP